MGNVISFPNRQNVADANTDFQLFSFRDREVAAAVAYLRNAADLIETAGRHGFSAEAKITDAVSEAKAGLFHLLTLAGCRNADRELRAALANTARKPRHENP